MTRPLPNAPRFRFLHGGTIVESVVQGNGGLVTSLLRLLAAKRVAGQGHTHGLYEPRPGCVALYPEYCAAGNGPTMVVALSSLLDNEGVMQQEELWPSTSTATR